MFIRHSSMVALLVAALGGCVTIQMPEVAQTHPAHPDAERPAAPVVPAILALPIEPVVTLPLPASAESAPSADPHADHGAHTGHGAPMPAPVPEGVYVCPMHPEVVSDEPGTCPICGMDLELQGDEP